MEKPISLKIKEFENDTVNLVNTSGLPLFVIEPILKKVLVAVQNKSEQEYQQDKLRYEQSLNEESKEKGEDQND